MLRLLAVVIVAGAVFAAPMLCLRFCELQDVVRARTPQALACMHAPRAAQEECGEHTPPFQHIQRVLSSITEFLLLCLVFLVRVRAARLRNVPEPRCALVMLALPDPPPRALRSLPALTLA